MSSKNFKSHRAMRHKTYLRVINALKAGVSSKRGIQDHSGLSWGSCSPVINNLLSQEVIVNLKVDYGKKVGKGRRTRHFGFNRKNHLLMGMAIDADHINTCIASLGNERLGSHLTKFSESLSSENVFQKVTKAFKQTAEKLSVDPENIHCISFSIPGAVDVDRNIWQYCERVPAIKDVKFNKIGGNGLIPKSIYIQHNIHAHAYSVIPVEEIQEGDYVFLHVGQGMALSANIGGIIYGHRGFAGEIGHIPYPYQQREISCLCGKKNCLEAILNHTSILEHIRHSFGLEIRSLDELLDQEIQQKVAVEYILDPLVYASTIVSNIFDPHRIIIEGSVLEPFYPYLKGRFEEKLRQSAWLKGPDKICWYHSNDMDGAYGAILHSGEKIINEFIDQIDLDH